MHVDIIKAAVLSLAIKAPRIMTTLGRHGCGQSGRPRPRVFRLLLVAATLACLAVFATSATAAMVVTGPPTAITSTSMTFTWSYEGPPSAHTDTGCMRAEVHTDRPRYEMGTTSYGPCATGDYELVVTGLRPNTPYTYRAVAAFRP